MICSQCNQDSEIHAKGLCTKCYFKIRRTNNKESANIKNLEYYYRNKNELLEYKKSRRGINKKLFNIWLEKNSGYMKKWQIENKELDYNNHKIYRIKNKDKLNKQKAERRQNDENFRLKENIRCLINAKLRNQNVKKSAKTEALIGCKFEEFKKYIESLWLSEMSWDNWGTEWEIDHIYQCNWFDLRDKEQQMICFNYKNQRPLWKTTDIANKYGYDSIVGNRNRDKKEVVIWG